MIRTLFLAGCWLTAAASLADDEVRYVDEGGITYRETKRVVRRPIAETQVQSRERTVYHPKMTTELQSITRNYSVPVTHTQWVPCMQRSWNPFMRPEMIYKQVRYTSWEPREETVRIPVSKTEMVPQKVVDQVPVTKQRFVEDVYTTRVAVGSKPSTTVAAGNSKPVDLSPETRAAKSDGGTTTR